MSSEAICIRHYVALMGRGEEVLMCTTQTHTMWHHRLGHLNKDYMNILFQKGLIRTNSKQMSICDSCQVAKSHAHPHPPRKTPYSLLELIFIAICGLTPIRSFHGFMYYVNLVQLGIPIVKKSDVYGVFDKFHV